MVEVTTAAVVAEGNSPPVHRALTVAPDVFVGTAVALPPSVLPRR
ncbi:MAG: hypothetical protein AAF580_17270 [Pseudomonadota bacterium]